LDDDGIYTGGCGGLGLLYRADLHHDPRPDRVGWLNMRGRISPEQDQHRHPLGEATVHRVIIHQRHDQIDPERLAGARAQPANMLGDRRRGEPAHPEHPQPARIRHRCRQFDSGQAAGHAGVPDRNCGVEFRTQLSGKHGGLW
jgi:hypothetical protein